jgi:nickel/cobalt transporter (NicO) family protein
MQRLPFLLLLLLLLLPADSLTGPVLANPFAPAGKEAPVGPFGSAPPREEKNRFVKTPEWYGKAIATASVWQRELRSAMASRAKEIKENPLGSAFWSFLFLAFGYGAVHALGPGHGKCFAVAYFASRPARLRQAVFLGGLMPAFHVASAVAIVLGLFFLFDAATLGGVQERSLLLQRISYLLLTLLGLFLVLKAVLDIFRSRDRESREECADAKSMLGLALAVGLVPCPATAIVLIFCISQDLLITGLAASLAIGLGMGLTTTMISAAAMYSRSGIKGSLSRWKRPAELAHRILALSGSLLIALVGLTLYLSLQ